MRENIKAMGHTEDVLLDEMQAYLSTGMVKDVSKGTTKKYLDQATKVFKAVFNEHYA